MKKSIVEEKVRNAGDRKGIMEHLKLKVPKVLFMKPTCNLTIGSKSSKYGHLTLSNPTPGNLSYGNKMCKKYEWEHQ
jgi:hypothetical protein